LLSEEANYWKRILEATLKIGLEHELNLLEKTGNCNGKSFLCPCSHPQKENSKCFTKCASYKHCTLRQKYECPGIYCVEFYSPCFTCKDAIRDCTKCALFLDENKNPSHVRAKLVKELTPSENLLKIGDNGVFQIVKDGSLKGDGGVEVTTVGRRVSYDMLLEQTKNIIDKCIAKGAYVDERASTHIHLLSGYYNIGFNDRGEVIPIYKKGVNNKHNIIELERAMPEIILTNFHQLIRRYHNALVWISSAGTSKDTLTRWAKFRHTILKFSALRRNMKSIIKEISESDGTKGRYSFINYSNIEFDSKEAIEKLHLEARFCDGLLSPSAITAISLLVYSLLIKAVSFSTYGILHSGDTDYMDEASEIQEKLLNNYGDYGGPRHSNTKNFEPYVEKVRLQAKEMVNLLKPELRGHGNSFNILLELAERPCSYRLSEGDSWDKIEKDLVKNKNKISKIVLDKISETIDTALIDECSNELEWISTVSEIIGAKTEQVKLGILYLQTTNGVIWDKESGTYVRP